MVERRFAQPLSFEQAITACEGQINAEPATLEDLSGQESIICCTAKVGFSPDKTIEHCVIGSRVPVLGECVMSPQPNCQDCVVRELERKLGRRVTRTVSVAKTKFDKHTSAALLESEGIKMELCQSVAIPK